MSIEPTLFGDVCLVRRWGRIGARGQRMEHTSRAKRKPSLCSSVCCVKSGGAAIVREVSDRDLQRTVTATVHARVAVSTLLCRGKHWPLRCRRGYDRRRQSRLGRDQISWKPISPSTSESVP
jgi:hypothetical protein